MLSRLLVLFFVLFAPLSPARAGQDDDDDVTTVVVTSSRVPQLVKDEPLHIEVVPAEEIEENLTVRPGDVSTLLNELPGARIQSVAPGLGGAGLQLRGLDTGYSQILLDGLPLLGSEAGAFGLLQTPPIDLQRVELLKGAASALYGGSALGGVLNLISQGADAESAVLVNASSHGAQDLLAFLTSGARSSWSGTATAAASEQSKRDLDHDGWADLAAYRRISLRPRSWRRMRDGNSLFVTAGVTDESRDGGTMPGSTLADGQSFANTLVTRKYDAGLVSDRSFASGLGWGSRVAWTSARQARVFDAQRVDAVRDGLMLESTWHGSSHGHDLLGGLAFVRDALHARGVAGLDYRYEVPAVFAQDEFSPASWLKLAASGRVDFHSQFGTFVSPRLSALVRTSSSDWSLRASMGSGFRVPTPETDEVAATSLGVLMPLRDLKAEQATTMSLDAAWSDDGLEANLSLFSSRIRHSLVVTPSGTAQLAISNKPGAQRITGAEILLRYVAGPWHAIASWTRFATLGDAERVPRDSGEIAVIAESAQRGRIGLELGFTGRQALADNPFRLRSESYVELNALAELRFGSAAVFFNATNITDVRQSGFDPLLRPSPGPGGNPIIEAWAPLAGRTFNLGLKVEL